MKEECERACLRKGSENLLSARESDYEKKRRRNVFLAQAVCWPMLNHARCRVAGLLVSIVRLHQLLINYGARVPSHPSVLFSQCLPFASCPTVKAPIEYVCRKIE